MSEESKRKLSIVRSGSDLVVNIETSIQQLHPQLAEFLRASGLPTEDILAPIQERLIVMRQFQDAVSLLAESDRRHAMYLSKYAVAITMGLFDAALNFLWDETIAALRRTVASFDLSYFFDVAEKREGHRTKLKDAEDLDKLGDLKLIDTCAHVGILSEVNRERLRHVNYMRNHASAAHPTVAEIHGAEMVGWLTNCLKYAITAAPDVAALEIKRLLRNIRETAIPTEDVNPILQEISKLPQQAIDDFLWTLFGTFVDLQTSEGAVANIRAVAPAIWEISTGDRKYEIGARHAHYLKHADQERKDRATTFLEAVDGLRYRSEDVLVIELLDRLRTLRDVHHGIDNFYNEWPHAKALKDALPPTGAVPRAARRNWVSVICQCYIGNGLGYREGVDESAVRYYSDYISRFNDSEIADFVRLFADGDFVVDLHCNKTESRAKSLAEALKEATSNAFIKRGLEVLCTAPSGTLKRVSNTTAFKKAIKNLPNSG